MAVTRGELQEDIYEILSKTPTAYGLLTPTKVNSMIQDSLDFISSKMMKIGGGWLTQVVYENITANTNYQPLPAGIAIVNFIKVKQTGSDIYVPIQFGEGAQASSDTSSTGTGNFRPTWRFSSSQLFLEPKPSTTVTDGLMFDAVFFPTRLSSDNSEIDGDLDNMTFVHYAKWRAASQLFAMSSKELPPWKQYELEWQQAALEQIARRFREPTPVRGFNDF